MKCAWPDPRYCKDAIQVFAKTRLDIAPYDYDRQFVQIRDFHFTLIGERVTLGERQNQALAIESFAR
jgi:hypothetical protein